MKYKQNNICVKLQKGGSVNKETSKNKAVDDHDRLVQWNLQHPNDKVYKIEDLTQKEKEANPSWIKKIANMEIQVPAMSPPVGWNGTAFYSQVPKVKSTVGKELRYTLGAVTSPMLLGELGTYGALAGGLRLAAGSAAAAGASHIAGKGGDWLDKKLGTNWIGDASRITAPFLAFPLGTKAVNPILKSAAGHGITMRMPQETFANLRNQYFANAGNKAMAKAIPDVVQTNIEAGKIGWAPSSKQTLWHNSDQPLTKLEINFPAWDTTQRGAPLGHSWFTGTETTEGFLGARPYHLKGNVELNKPMIQLGEAIGNGKNNTRNQILNFAQKSSADAINFKGIADNTLQNQDVYSVFKNVNLNDNLKLDGILRTRGSAQEAATTYHFDGRIPLSRPISEVELKGWPKQFRNQRRRQISASEYSGLPKGERNNGRYGDIRFIRHMDAIPELTKDGFVQVAPEENWLANFTTDQLMVPHKSYSVEGIGKNVLVISPEAFRGTTPFSLDPGDSFFINRELKIKPKHVTFISGDPQSIQLAKERGFNVETSPKLKILSELSKQATWEEQQTMRPALEKRGYWFHGREYPKIKSDYVDELNRILHSRFNRPSLKDYSNIESITGVPTHTYSRSTAPQQSFFGPKTGYQQAIYDTTPQIEHDLMKQIGSYAHPMAESMEGYSPLFFRLRKGWTPIKKQGGKI